MNKKNIFRGFKPVFKFTAKQNLKTKGFIATTVIIALLMFIIPFGGTLYMSIAQKGDTQTEEPADTPTEESFINDIYFVNNTDMPDEMLTAAVASYNTENSKNITVKVVHNEDESTILKNSDMRFKEAQVIYSINSNEDSFTIKTYVLADNKDVKNEAENLSDYLVKGIPTMSYAMAGLEMDTIVNMEASHSYVITKAGEQEQDMGVMLLKLLAPMLVGLLLYMLINMSAQSVTKVVIAEKTSKLMETLLTSAMPYGIIAGKILAVTAMAIVQMLLWLVSLVIGVSAGHLIGNVINPGYENFIIEIVNLVKESAASAFSVPAVIIGIIILMLGFLFYCVYAGLTGAFVQKAEDLGNAQTFLVFPLMISWLAAYLAPALENEALLGFIRLFPLTSPFSIPADVIVGNVGIVMALVSLLILVVVTFVMIIVTGWIYKKRVFK